jgi:hypothetical protein
MNRLNIMKLNKEEETNLKYLIEVLINDRLFFPDRPFNEVEFDIKKLSVFRSANNISGFPNQHVIAKYRFNYKDLFEKLHNSGYVTINEDYRCLRFLGWKIKTNYQTMLNLKKELDSKILIHKKQENENALEAQIRDAIRNNTELVFPSKTPNGIKIPKSDSIKREKIKDCGECDIVCRINNEIVFIAEITKSSVTEDYIERRIPKRKFVAPKAKIWIIASRVGDNYIRRLQRLNVEVTTFEQLRNVYPNTFNFL